MKYALIINEERANASGVDLEINFGDYIQWLKIEELYNAMGIHDSDIVRLSAQALKTYSGETLILPFNYMVCNNERCPYLDENSQFNFSDDVKPIFLGFSIKKGFFDWNFLNIAYLKKHEPIGCRDYRTYLEVKKQGINAYIAGCITATFKKRENTGKQDTTYFIEVPESIKSYIPKEIKNNCKFVYHQLNTDTNQFNNPDFGQNMAVKMLKEYRENAKLVVASRLHAIIPCMAMGIPVIPAKEYFGYPFDLIKKFSKTFSYRDFKNIDWNIPPVEMESYKKLAIDCAIKRIKGEDATETINKLHNEYAGLYDSEYKEEFMDQSLLFDKLRKLHRNDDEFSYALWGFCDQAEVIFNHISENYPNAKLVKVFDSYVTGSMHGVNVELPDSISKNSDFLIIATTLNVSSVVQQLFDKIGVPKGGYICAADRILTKDNFMEEK